jgi:hypothetical protein
VLVGVVGRRQADSGAVGEVVLDRPQERDAAAEHLRFEAILPNADEAAQLRDQQPQRLGPEGAGLQRPGRRRRYSGRSRSRPRATIRAAGAGLGPVLASKW